MKLSEQEAVETVEIHPNAQAKLIEHCRLQARRGGFEAVGFLACHPDDGRITVLAPMHNHSSDPTKTFFVEPWEQFRMERKLIDNGLIIVGVYHSHPSGEARPSRADETMARPGELMAIYSVVFDELRVWREKDGRLVPVEVSNG